MYGTVSRFRLKPGSEAKIAELSREYESANVPGFVSDHVYKLDSGGDEYIMTVAFESREAYQANANSPEQHARFLKFRELLQGEPHWHDGEIVYSYSK